MPKKPKKFEQVPSRPKPQRPSAAKRGYGRAWQKFRLWYASIHPAICCAVLPNGQTCGAALPSHQMHLDHEPPLVDANDAGLLDATRVRWHCVHCHSAKTLRDSKG